jgi:hypothetical protein
MELSVWRNDLLNFCLSQLAALRECIAHANDIIPPLRDQSARFSQGAIICSRDFETLIAAQFLLSTPRPAGHMVPAPFVGPSEISVASTRSDFEISSVRTQQFLEGKSREKNFGFRQRTISVDLFVGRDELATANGPTGRAQHFKQERHLPWFFAKADTFERAANSQAHDGMRRLMICA